MLLEFLFSHEVLAIGLVLQQTDEGVAFLALEQFLFGPLFVSGAQSRESPENSHRGSEEDLPSLGTAVSLGELENLGVAPASRRTCLLSRNELWVRSYTHDGYTTQR